MSSVGVASSASDDEVREVYAVYDAVFGDQPDLRGWRSGVWDRHAARAGFRLARAYDEGGRLVGFGYGYTGERGQWWTDQAWQVLAPEVARAWLGRPLRAGQHRRARQRPWSRSRPAAPA